MATSPRLGYVMSRYPHLSETFITRELTELSSMGVEVGLLPLMAQEQAVVHEEAEPWVRVMRPLGLSSDSARAWARLTRRRPRLAARMLASVVAGYRGRPAELARALPVLGAGAKLAEEVTELRLDRLHVHYATYPALAAWAAHQICGVPYGITVHAHDIFMTQAMLGPKLEDADLIVSISDFNRRFLLREVGHHLAPKIETVHCGVRVEQYAPAPARTTAPTPDDPLRLVCTGSLQEYKGQAHLIDAVGVLTTRKVPVHATLIGHGPDEAALREQIHERGLENHVELTGALPQDEVRQRISTAEVYVQPSIVARTGQMEGIPVSLMEALACRLPVVATELSGIPELVRDQGSAYGPPTGYLVRPADGHALAAAIHTIADDPAEAHRRAQRGQGLVASEFDLAQNVAALAALMLNRLPERNPS